MSIKKSNQTLKHSHSRYSLRYRRHSRSQQVPGPHPPRHFSQSDYQNEYSTHKNKNEQWLPYLLHNLKPSKGAKRLGDSQPNFAISNSVKVPERSVTRMNSSHLHPNPYPGPGDRAPHLHKKSFFPVSNTLPNNTPPHAPAADFAPGLQIHHGGLAEK